MSGIAVRKSGMHGVTKKGKWLWQRTLQNGRHRSSNGHMVSFEQIWLFCINKRGTQHTRNKRPIRKRRNTRRSLFHPLMFPLYSLINQINDNTINKYIDSNIINNIKFPLNLLVNNNSNSNINYIRLISKYY